jgi:hypothetical protein
MVILCSTGLLTVQSNAEHGRDACDTYLYNGSPV